MSHVLMSHVHVQWTQGHLLGQTDLVWGEHSNTLES